MALRANTHTRTRPQARRIVDGRFRDQSPGHIRLLRVGLERRPAGIQVDLYRSHRYRLVESGPGLERERPTFPAINVGDAIPSCLQSIAGNERSAKEFDCVEKRTRYDFVRMKADGCGK
jgi:hypothetical protein